MLKQKIIDSYSYELVKSQSIFIFMINISEPKNIPFD